jgi:hypothetical protein
MYFHPSIIAHTLNGAFFIVAVILSLVYYKTLANLDSYRFILLILAFGIMAGIHGISHLGLEYVYGYNPCSVWYPLQGRQGRQMTCPCPCPCHRQMQRQKVEGFQMKPEGGPTCAIRGDD